MKNLIKIPTNILILLCLFGLGSIYAQPTNYDREWGTYDGGAISLQTSSVVDANKNLFLSYVSSMDELYVQSTIDKFSSTGEFLLKIPFETEDSSVYIDDIKLDHNQDLIICGWTNSPDAFGTSGAWQEENAGLYDRFLAKLDSETGAVIWSTYFGGAANDEDGEGDSFWEYNSLIAITTTNDIVWTTNMRSADMGTTGVFQEQRNGNSTNYVISMFDATGQRIWTTYYGYDHSNISGLQVDDSGIYVAGQTGYNFGGAMSDPYFDSTNTQSVPAYKSGAYISKFDYTGNRLWGHYFGGNNDEYLVKNVLGQTANKLYLTGFSTSAEGITTEGTYLPSIANFTTSGFLVQFDKEGIYQWGTYLGEKLDYGGSYPGIIADENTKKIYVVGHTTTSEGLATPGAFQETRNGNNDAFVMEFDNTGQRKFGTYYGGENDEEALFIILAPFSGGFYLTGLTNSLTGISTPGAFQETYEGDSSYWPDALYIAKFVEAPLGINGFDQCDNGFKLYPIPAKETITLDLNECTSVQNYKGIIYNSLGQQVYSFESVANPHSLDISKLPSGIYHIQIDIGNSVISKLFIKD